MVKRTKFKVISMLSANAFQSKKLNGELYDCLVFTYIDY